LADWNDLSVLLHVLNTNWTSLEKKHAYHNFHDSYQTLLLPATL